MSDAKARSHILSVDMDQAQALEKARQFARMRYTGESERIVLEHENQIFEMRERAAAQGILMSSTTVMETARIHASKIEALTRARLSAILEGYELYEVEVDDQMAINICDEIIQGMNNNFCRCGAHTRIIDAIQSAAAEMKGGSVK